MANMTVEIVAFMLSVSGFILVSSTLPTDYWKVSSIDGTVITTATFWANLWKTCVTDSTGVSNCKDFPSMLALDAYIQVCRGLMIAAVCLGFFGFIFSLVGMKCTKVGGSDRIKGKITVCAGMLFIFSGLASVIAFSWYANRITAEFYDPMIVEQKYELGAALFIGWAGSSLSILGGAMFCFSLSNGKDPPRMGYGYNATASLFSSRAMTHNATEDMKSTRNGGIPPKQFDKNAYV
ncbi:claudin-10-like [Scyliorhinus canicula]|uniref:claudin-10-like n=1 Tax=Scyliorhinus canicula TaxID=7830 RepID=UPI0018F38BB9|nr:claudin-10-like [Scyliorhinus canicula]